MDFGLAGKRAFVGGASSGLGAAVAMELAAEGAQVTICSRSKEHLEETAETIMAATGNKPLIQVADIADKTDLERLCEVIRDQKMDILVSNGGGPPAGQLGDFDSAAWDGASKLLLRPAVELTKAALVGMKERKFGRLIFITSIAVLQPVNNLILSNTYRAGVTAFCKTVSNTHAQYGITANCVCPGYTGTERLNDLAEKMAAAEGIKPEKIMDRFAASTAAGRIGQPEELAALVTFLASDKAAYITGCSIPVDGGAYKALV